MALQTGTQSFLWWLLTFQTVACSLTAQSVVLEGLPVREIRIDGLRRTSQKLVLEQLSSSVGEAYSERSRSRDVEYLDRLGIFSSIEVAAEACGGGVCLRVSVRETFPYTVYVSATKTEENGLSLGPGAGAINLAGRAIRAGLAMEFGGATNFFADVHSPRLTRVPWWYEAELSHISRDDEVHHFQETSWQSEGRVGYQFRPSISLAGVAGFISMRSDKAGITLNPSGRDIVPALSLEWIYDTRDRWTNPRSGWMAIAAVTHNGVFGGDGNWWTTQFEGRRYQAFTERHGLASFSFAALQSGELRVNIPYWAVYGIGGSATVRGWESGARLGKNQWLNTLEYRYQLVKPRPMRFLGYSLYWGLHLALYGDLGTAWTQSGDFSRNFIGSVGYGVRLIIPYVGVVRFDRAYGNGLRPAYGLGETVDSWRDRVR